MGRLIDADKLLEETRRDRDDAIEIVKGGGVNVN